MAASQLKQQSFGIRLALWLDMRKFIATTLFISLTVTPLVTFAQKRPSEVAQKQRSAGQVADRFVERFRQTLDFGIAWKTFRLSDPSCTQRANGILSERDYERLRLSSGIIEKLYIATMNYYYLRNAYDLSVGRMDSQSASGDSSTPLEIEAVEKKSKFFQDEDHKIESVAGINELIGTFNQLAQLYRRHLPKPAMKSATWQANQKYLISRNGTDHEGILNGSETFCVSQQAKVYMVDRGLFYFYVVEEGGKMRVAGFGID
jgi:hypothetical protein